MRSVMPRPAISDRYLVAMSPYPRALSAMFLALTLAGCSKQDPEPLELAPYDARGPFTVGFRTLEAPASGDAPALTVKVWYPAAAGTPAQDEIDYALELKQADWQGVKSPVVHGHAVADAPVQSDYGARPVVVFSHGYSLNPEWYAELLEHYASKGFVVLAPEHVEADWLLAGGPTFARPRAVTRTLDLAASLAGEGPFAGGIDMERVAVVGHSFGGYTTLAAAGARLDLAALEERCAAVAPEDPKAFLCAPYQGRAEELAALAGLDEVPSGLWPSQGDPRVDAIVPMSGDAHVFSRAGLSSITIPMMAIGGTGDFVTPWDWASQLAYEGVSSARKSLLAFVGAGHQISTDSCENMSFASQLPELHREVICTDPAWDKAAARRWIRHFSTAFLLDVLTGDAEAKAALASGAEVPPELVHTATP
jgi:predicted dienelactone hydrolase